MYSVNASTGAASEVAPTALLLLLPAIWFYSRRRERGEVSATGFAWKRIFALACLALVVNGCGGGGSGSAVQQPPPPPPPVITPSGTYTLTVAPSPTPAGSTKSFPLSAISLTLVVK
jgi:hypothetical protein